MRGTILAMALVCACDSTQPAGDDVADDDDSESVDAPIEVDARGVIVETVSCEPHLRTIVNANGSRTEQTVLYAVFDDIGHGDDFIVHYCTTVFAETCPAGATCTGSNYPPGETCFQNRGNGLFFGGKLGVTCGSTYTTYDASGTQTSTSTTTYTDIQVSKL